MKQDPVTVRRVRSPSEVSTSSPMAQPGRNPSEPSLLSRSTASSGPSKKEPAFITSAWGIGWKTPTLMITCYVLALAIAFTHLLLFRFIDGKEADGPNRVAPQSYITTASNILANAFGIVLRLSLSVAFVQHLWHLLRVYTMKVSTIEALFSVRSNPFMLFRSAAAAPLLCILAVIMLVSQIVTGFPPGAITVVSSQRASYVHVVVPTFNASFMGNGSGVDANAYSLVNLTPVQGPMGFVSGAIMGGKNANLINRLARQVLVAGDSLNLASPCESNCSYVMEFEGPYFDCNTTTDEVLYHSAAVYFNIYSGLWFSPVQESLNPALFYNGTYTQANFTSTTLAPLQINGTDLDGAGNSSVLMQQKTTLCVPGRAKYTVNNTWVNNVQSRTFVTEPIDQLISIVVPVHDNEVIVPGFCEPSGLGLGTVPANWSTDALAYYRDNNMMTIFTSMMSWLNGTFSAYLASGVNTVVLPGDYLTYVPYWTEDVTSTISGVANSAGAQYGTVVDSTRFNAAFGQYTTAQNPHPSFTVTQDLMNEYLFNMTTSIMTAYGNWNTTATATKLTIVNIYSFSQPLSLILPYFITLLLALPFVVLGCLALFRNGVSAMDGSFTQIITTSTGSAILDRAAAGGCLGGNESVPTELKDLKIRFGEFVGREEPGKIKRAGFGVDGEVTSLIRGANYGIARWI